jgi:hypothetical protein
VPLPTDAAAWLSDDDGSTWTRAEAAGFVKDGCQEMRGVTAYEDGFVAVGYDGKDAAVWHFDGATWRQLATQAGLAVGEPGRRVVDREPRRLSASADSGRSRPHGRTLHL